MSEHGIKTQSGCVDLWPATLRSVGGGWSLIALEKSERILLVRAGKLFLIDENLRISRPAGDWRLRLPEVIYLPGTGEALVTTAATGTGIAGRGLFWIRDRRISGSDICGKTKGGQQEISLTKKSLQPECPTLTH